MSLLLSLTLPPSLTSVIHVQCQRQWGIKCELIQHNFTTNESIHKWRLTGLQSGRPVPCITGTLVNKRKKTSDFIVKLNTPNGFLDRFMLSPFTETRISQRFISHAMEACRLVSNVSKGMVYLCKPCLKLGACTGFITRHSLPTLRLQSKEHL